MDLCVFDIFYNFLKIQMDHEAMSVLTVLIFYNMIFIIFMDLQTFAFVHCIFSIHQHLGIFCTPQGMASFLIIPC
jgi:hypothetical protein